MESPPAVLSSAESDHRSTYVNIACCDWQDPSQDSKVFHSPWPSSVKVHALAQLLLLLQVLSSSKGQEALTLTLCMEPQDRESLIDSGTTALKHALQMLAPFLWDIHVLLRSQRPIPVTLVNRPWILAASAWFSLSYQDNIGWEPRDRRPILTISWERVVACVATLVMWLATSIPGELSCLPALWFYFPYSCCSSHAP